MLRVIALYEAVDDRERAAQLRAALQSLPWR
jgi:hypothetical protein